MILANIPIKNTAIPGGIAVIDFETKYTNPKAFYRTVPLYVQHIKNNHWQALLGIPLMEKLGKKSITVKDFSSRIFEIEVKKYAYKEQYITLKDKNKKYINPINIHMKRIKNERPVLSKPRMTFSAQRLSNGMFTRPIDGITTGMFGVKRFYNGAARRPHTGLDYAGSIGTAVKAPANGKVLLTGNYFFNGNTIFLDHGQGLISVYIHLNKNLVKQGQLVKQGEIIGTVGKSGRATGPHLHWGIFLNGAAVNPTLLLQ